MRATAGILLIAIMCVSDAAHAERRLVVITAAAHNYADVPTKVLSEAETKVAQVFREAGVDLTWVDPLESRTTVRVHLLSRPMSVRTRMPVEVLGLASVESAMVYVLYDRVIDKSALLNVRASDLLAYVIAHEIGHVLLDGRPHNVVGLMRPRLDPDVLRRGLLGFTREEGRQMAGTRAHH